jgi:hypothetical protein
MQCQHSSQERNQDLNGIQVKDVVDPLEFKEHFSQEMTTMLIPEKVVDEAAGEDQREENISHFQAINVSFIVMDLRPY